MSRRALTTFLAALLAVGLGVLGSSQTVPYVLLAPGPVFNTLGADGGSQVLAISGRQTYPTDGALDATTVSVTDHISLFTALKGWLSGDEAVVPRELVYPPGQSQKQTNQQNEQDMRQSQDNATVAAMQVLGIKGMPMVSVVDVRAHSPADGHLMAGDLIATIDGTAVSSVESLRALIGRHKPGQTVLVGYVRNGTAGSVRIGTTAAPDGTHRPLIGIQAQTTVHYPVTVDIRLRDVGGPSAGLMFALGIIDKLQPGSLTGGRVIAGTGEIDTSGNVGIIGGIAQKMRGARAEGATVFLVPSGNCQEARGNRPSGLRLVKVSTLRGALAALTLLRDGGSPPSC